MGDSLFTGKKVVIIGPAPHIVEKEQSFDQFDLVCRINNAVHLPDILKEKTNS